MVDGRSYCIVPDCDEQPRPGDELCETHQSEDIGRFGWTDGDVVERFIPHGATCEADDGRGSDFGRCHEPARAYVATERGERLVCEFHRQHWHGDTLQIRVVKSGVENAKRLGMSARSCASCGVPLTLEREIHVCTECAKKGGA